MVKVHSVLRSAKVYRTECGHSNELSLCVLCVTPMWVYGPDASACVLTPRPRPWLRIYTGMPADSLSCCVNIPPVCSLLAQIQKTDPEHSHQAHFSPPAFTPILIILPQWVSASSNSDSHLIGITYPITHVFRHGLPISFLDVFFTSLTGLQRIVCRRLIIHHRVSSTQIKEKWRFSYHFSKQQGDWWVIHVSLTRKWARSFN